MGKEVTNIATCFDYSLGEFYIRLHRDILLPRKVVENIGELLNKDQFDEAEKMLLEKAVDDNLKELIRISFKSKKERQPAPWYNWKSKYDGKIFCSQTSPGSGWELYSGPYKDARCEIPC